MSDDNYQWSKALKRAIRRNRRDAHNRYLQLATVRRDGTPAVRSLVFRAFCDETMQLRMVTDRRSAKTDDIAVNPVAEICWYFAQSREQFRLRGLLRARGAEAENQGPRRALWDNLSEKAREPFYGPHPGADPGHGSGGASAAAEGPPDDFLLLELTVTAVDHLTLRGEPQTRVLSHVDAQGAWASRPVNP